MSKNAFDYSFGQFEAIRDRVNNSPKGGVIEKQVIIGPVPSKVHDDKRPCIRLEVTIKYPDDSSTKVTFENPTGLDYTNKEDFFVDHITV